MKSALMTGIVAVVFVAGIGVGLLLQQAPPPQPAPAASPSVVIQQTAPAVHTVVQPELAAAPGPAGADPASASAPSAQPAGPAAPDNAPAVHASAPPPSEPPPPLSPESLAEGKRAAQDDPAQRGNGRVTHLVYDFDTPEEREAWEAKRRQNWQVRKQREIDIKIRGLRQSVGLSSAQEPRLREILEAELAERQRLVDQLANDELSRSSFDEGVKQNLAHAKQALGELLTAEQLEAYQQLKPREQVLQQETSSGF